MLLKSPLTNQTIHVKLNKHFDEAKKYFAGTIDKKVDLLYYNLRRKKIYNHSTVAQR